MFPQQKRNDSENRDRIRVQVALGPCQAEMVRLDGVVFREETTKKRSTVFR